MKDLSMLVWLTQLGLSVAAPLVCFLMLADWLKDRFGFGNWIMIAALIMGLSSALSGLKMTLKAAEQMSRGHKKQDPPPISFNDHF